MGDFGDELWTTFKARTYVQAQFKKAATMDNVVKGIVKGTMVDRSAKDYIIFHRDEFNVSATWRDSRGTGASHIKAECQTNPDKCPRPKDYIKVRQSSSTPAILPNEDF